MSSILTACDVAFGHQLTIVAVFSTSSRLEPTSTHRMSTFWTSASLIIDCCAGPANSSDHYQSTIRRRTAPDVVIVDEFKASLRQSTLCTDLSDGADGVGDDDATADSLVDRYDSVITSIADRVAPIKTTSCRRRASDVWFDGRVPCRSQGVSAFGTSKQTLTKLSATMALRTPSLPPTDTSQTSCVSV